MLGALGRWLRAVGYLFTGRIDDARRALDTDPHVVRAKYDEIVREKTSRIQQYKRAVASLIAQQENKVQKVKNLTADVERLERLKAGALAKAKQQVEKLRGEDKTKEDIQDDADYKKCLSAYNDFSSTLTEKQDRIAELEGDITQYGQRIDEHKIQLQELARDIEKIRAETADAVADFITAKEEKELADAFSGIAEDGTAEELQRMRQLRQEVKAEARISKELAGTDTKVQEAEFLEYARTSTSNAEFDALIGLADSPPADAEPAEKTRSKAGEFSSLPE